jgi:DNA (cytosine-5)-methyltransferase 1
VGLLIKELMVLSLIKNGEKNMSKRKKIKRQGYKILLEELEESFLNEKQEKMAYITHYLQNIGTKAEISYKKDAVKYLAPEFQPELFAWNFPFSPPVNIDFTFIDLFAGTGGMRLAFQNSGGKCVFTSEWDKIAQITYKENFGEVPFGDITKIDAKAIPDHDILVAGFPCQPFSIAGYKKGFKDKGRGNLFFDIVRILDEKKPTVFLLENVKNLNNHDAGKTYKIIKQELENTGYTVKAKVLNTMEYGNLPQNRERIYIVGFLNEKHSIKFSFPEKTPLTKTIHSCLEENVDEKYYYNGKNLYNKLEKEVKRKDTIYQWRRKYVRENKSNVCPTLTANMGMGGHNVPIILDSKGIRKLTPRECATFQGFPKNFELPLVADSHLYKQLGNAVSIPVIEKIIDHIKKAVA